MTQLTLIDSTWISQNIATVLDHFRGQDFCADDLHGLLPEPMHYNYYGKLMAAMVQSGKIMRVGFMRSKRPGRNRSWIGIYTVI